MLPTYKAVLHGDRVEWADDVPAEARRRESAFVFVTFVGSPADDDESQGRRMADALERLAARGGPSTIGDPLDWQRDQGDDRPLPGRNG